MITEVSLKNFKLHAETKIKAAPITVFIGPNNSGKSSIFQALLSLRQAASMGWDTLYHPNRHQFPEKLIIDIGEYEDVLRHGENEIQIGVEGTVHSTKQVLYGQPLKMNFNVHLRDNRPVYHSGSLESLHVRVGSLPSRRTAWEWVKGQKPLTFFISVENCALHFIPTGQLRLLDQVRIDVPPQFPQEKQKDIAQFHEYLGETPNRLLNSLHPIFPLRGFEQWGYPLPDSSAANLDRIELPDRAVALASLLAYNRDLERTLSEWLEEQFEIAIEAPLVPPKRVVIRAKKTKNGKTSSLFLNEGTGASQLPFILIPIGLTPPNETILLSEPEAHLHPEGQSKLMRLLLKARKDRNLQYFIETHSEHILHSLLHAVAKGDLEKSQLAIYYFENDKGTAKVRPLKIDERGGVEGGLPGFFEHSLTELSEYLDALKKT